MIALSDPILGEEEKRALCEVIDSRWLTMGDRVAAFEKAFAEMHGFEESVAVNSCTAALHLALMALDIGPGDEVLVPSLTLCGHGECPSLCGATPVFVDIQELDKPHISIEDARDKCTFRTKAVIVMHYGGYSVDLPAWRSFSDRKGVMLVEDAAHSPAVGEIGRWSDVAAFSFFSNKNMSVELDDVRYALEKAARLATDADDAPYEYADHVFSISGNTALALELVNSYLARFSERMRELLLLKADCLSDLDKEGPADEVLRLVEDFSKLLAHAGDIR